MDKLVIFHAIKVEVGTFETSLNPPVIFLLTVPWLYFFCGSFLFVCPLPFCLVCVCSFVVTC